MTAPSKADVLGDIHPAEQYYRLTPTCRNIVRTRLLEAPVADAGHGRHTRAADVFGVAFTSVVRCCMGCGRAYPMTFMLRDEVWATIADAADVYCFVCAERRLGRHVTSDDLNDAPCNDALKYILDTRRRTHADDDE